MKSDITWLIDRLPPIEKIKLRSEPDYYGISRIIANELGHKRTPRSFAQWLHGWIYTRPITHPQQIAFWGMPNDSILVATQFEARCLQDFGYKKVNAVGMPFVYTRDLGITRQPNSLLIMPAHSGANHTIEIDADSYIQNILTFKSHFTEIVACIHSSCVVNGYWTSMLEKYEIPWIVGASVFDRNALQRMRNIFQSFEYVTTNTIGSHIPYAAYSGCKVGIFNYQRYSLEDYKNDVWYLKYPELLLKDYELSDEQALRLSFPLLFSDPDQASLNFDWAKLALGEENKRSASEIHEILGWDFKDQLIGYLKFWLKQGSSIGNLRALLAKFNPQKRKDGFELDVINKSKKLQSKGGLVK